MKVNPPAAERRGRSYLLVDSPAPPPDHPGGPDPDPSVRIRKILPQGQTTQQLHLMGAEFKAVAIHVGYISRREAQRMIDEAPMKRARKIAKAEIERVQPTAKTAQPEAKKPRSESATRGWETRRAKAEARESAPDPDPTFTGTEGEPSS